MSKEVGAWIRKNAEEDGLSVASWLRNLLSEEASSGRHGPLRRRVTELETRVGALEGQRRGKEAKPL